MNNKFLVGVLAIVSLTMTLIASPQYKAYKFSEGTKNDIARVVSSEKVLVNTNMLIDVVRDGFLIGKGRFPTREESNKHDTSKVARGLVNGYKIKLELSDKQYAYIRTTKDIKAGTRFLVRRFKGIGEVQAVVLNLRGQEGL